MPGREPVVRTGGLVDGRTRRLVGLLPAAPIRRHAGPGEGLWDNGCRLAGCHGNDRGIAGRCFRSSVIRRSPTVSGVRPAAGVASVEGASGVAMEFVGVRERVGRSVESRLRGVPVSKARRS